MVSTLITAPAVEPVTLAQVRASCRVTVTDEDAMLSAMITAAREECESLIRRCLITQTWEDRRHCFPSNRIELGRGRVQSVTHVKYVNTAGAETTVSTSVYQLNVDGRISLKYAQLWPTPVLDQDESVRIRYVCGFGDEADDVPLAIRQWIIQRVVSLWNNRDSVVVGASVDSLPFVDSLLDPWRVAGVY